MVPIRPHQIVHYCLPVRRPCHPPLRLAGEQGEEGPAHLENGFVQCLLLLLHWLRHYSRLTVPLAPLASRPHLGLHRGHVTHCDAAVRWLRRALGPRPGCVPTLFRRAPRVAHVLRLTLPTRPDTPSGPFTSARPGPCVYMQPLHHLLGFPSAKYCLFVTLCCRCTVAFLFKLRAITMAPTPLPSSSALRLGGTRLQPSRRSLWPRRCPFLRPSRGSTVPVPFAHPVAPAPPHAPVLACTRSPPHRLPPSALTPSRSVYAARRRRPSRHPP